MRNKDVVNSFKDFTSLREAVLSPEAPGATERSLAMSAERSHLRRRALHDRRTSHRRRGGWVWRQERFFNYTHFRVLRRAGVKAGRKPQESTLVSAKATRGRIINAY